MKDKKKKTKEKILHSALSLFNQEGLPNVKLQRIADDCNISVGNLAYHFQYKEDLMANIAGNVNAEISSIVNTENHFPMLIDFDNQLSKYHTLINRYAFFFLDVLELERNYPTIHQQRVRYINVMINQIYQWITENEKKGIFKAEIHLDQYAHTAHAIWMIISFWLTQKRVLFKKDQDEEEFKILVWNQLLPSFTELGLMEYEAMILPQLRDIEIVVGF
ncbi:TetR/AcrR family transcriptional regulator [Cecembia sp.]|uniref:TetR/AcrR family transcriptional regulator n=1 Tax=Cecembia sp. TaxID=1898110 RepID=UPI0025C42298|nr:TetR/AcrR family transcriptional regulator [Cecembia sp.]